MIFDGKAFAREIEAKVAEQVSGMAQRPKIVSILVGNDPASELYTRLKKAAAERVGVEFEVVRLSAATRIQDLESSIVREGARADVSGVMVQLPILGLSQIDVHAILEAIPVEKDVDGLRWETSHVLPAVVKAVLSIVKRIGQDKTTFAVLGSGGAVGKPLVTALRDMGKTVYEIEADTQNPAQLTQKAEVVISCVGKAGVVTPSMIREASIVIDVGMSSVEGKVVGDMTPEVYQKASIAVAVPGGVGPVTIASLMANCIAAKR